MEQLFSFHISTFSKRIFHKIPFQKPYETKPFLDLALTSFSWRPVQEPAGRPRLCSRAGQARLPLQRAVSYRGSFSQYFADFRCRARAARPAWLGWHGSRLCGYDLLWDLVFLYVADSRYPGMGALAPITKRRLPV